MPGDEDKTLHIPEDEKQETPHSPHPVSPNIASQLSSLMGNAVILGDPGKEKGKKKKSQSGPSTSAPGTAPSPPIPSIPLRQQKVYSDADLQKLWTRIQVKKSQIQELFTAASRALYNIPPDVAQAKIKYECVVSRLTDFSQLHDVFLDKLVDHDFIYEYQQQERWACELTEAKCTLLSDIQRFESHEPIPHGRGTPLPDAYRIKLPKRELPKFDGNVRNWLQFWASFKEIDDDLSIPTAEKYHYLLQSMTKGSDAYKVVASFPDPENYDEALKSLSSRFGNKNTLIKVYVRDLLKLVIDNAKEKSSTPFSDLVTSLTSQVRNLEKLGVTLADHGNILYPIIESCIPAYTLEAYMRNPKCKQETSDLIEFLNFEVERKLQSSLSRAPFKDDKDSASKQTKGGKSATTTANFSVSTDGNTTDGCVFCTKKGHKHTECIAARDLDLDKKRQIVETNGICARCLSLGHHPKQCKVKVRCFLCPKAHHSLMCPGNQEKAENPSSHNSPKPRTEERLNSGSGSVEPSSSNSAATSTQMANYLRKPEVILQTLMVDVHGRNGVRRVRAMFDTGSQSSYILTRIAKELDLPYLGKERTSHVTFGGHCSSEQVHPVYKIEISALGNDQTYKFEVSGVDKISAKLDTIPEGSWLEECKTEGIFITDVRGAPREIEALIGSDVAGKLTVGQRSVELPSGPVAQQTQLGWVLQGKLPMKKNFYSNSSLFCVNMANFTKEVFSLWELEAIGVGDAAETKSRKEIEEAASHHFIHTVSRSSSGRYIVHLPWVDCHPSLPDNKGLALKRLHSITKSLSKDGYLLKYHDVLQNWLAEGIVEVAPEKAEGTIHYLPHRAVFKEGSTTPLRPVFDASAKLKHSPSLNMCLEKGPNLLELIPAVLTRFRLGPVGAVADIKKAFLQMEVIPVHRDSMRFLWWNNPITKDVVTELRHCRVVFGVSSSPFLLGATLNFHLSQPSDFPETAERLRKSFYVDNSVASFPSLQAAKQFQTEAEALLRPALFDLRGWEFGPAEEQKYISVLGLQWELKSDTLRIDIANLNSKVTATATKRSILALANSVYDPLGFLAPFTLNIKLLLKSVWSDTENFTWDTLLPLPYQDKFSEWKSQLHKISEVQIPRFVGELNNSSNFHLHIFCDASKVAYAACAFLRHQLEGKVSAQLLFSKTRVSPQKSVTIPRLELLSCVIGSRIAAALKEYTGIKDINTTFWTDSTTALTWIQRDSIWATFVNNRVKEIHSHTLPTQWKHIPGEHNPADLISRGCTIDRMLNLRWWEGPLWLREPEHNWPTTSTTINEEEVDSERRKTVVSALATKQEKSLLQQFESYGDYHRILRVLAIVKRFVTTTREKRRTQSTTTVAVTHPIKCTFTFDELEVAETHLIKLIQKPFSQDQSKIKGLKCRMYEDGIVRVSTKLFPTDDSPFSTPAVLPGKHPIVRLLIEKEHSLASHAGVQYLQCILRERFWILKSRRSIGNVVHGCPVCRRYSAERCGVEPPPLPLLRTQLSKTFEVTGVDMAGPLVVDGTKKVWITLFTCAVYRAVHLELVTELSTAAFLGAFSKFISRRGRPKVMFSDNGRNFAGAAKILTDLHWSTVWKATGLQKISWRFIPPAAANWGGWWERMVGLLKQLLRKVIGSRRLKQPQLEVLLCEAEAVLNNRPLCYISDDPEDLKPLTPSMFLSDLQVAALPES